MSCLGEPPPPTPALFDFDRDIGQHVVSGVQVVMIVVAVVLFFVLVVATIPLWGPFWLIGYLAR